MRDVREDLSDLWRASGHLSRAKGGRAIMFLSASGGEGTSSIAASFALMTADRAQRTTWLVDLDIYENQQIRAFQNGFASNAGFPGRAYDASLDMVPFYDVIGAGKKVGTADARAGKLLAAHQISGTRLLVTRFRHERILSGTKVKFTNRGEWWTKLKRSADWIIVDAPALETSKESLKIVRNMDGVVVVVRSDATSVEDVQTLKSEVEQAGGHVLGIVMNQVSGDSLIADRLAS